MWAGKQTEISNFDPQNQTNVSPWIKHPACDQPSFSSATDIFGLGQNDFIRLNLAALWPVITWHMRQVLLGSQKKASQHGDDLLLFLF